jgi:23S rRNA (cytidine1920-2'-O)/16S rRNA (cytidine1409-2'-O)-methyltransferase
VPSGGHKTKEARERLDVRLVALGLAPSRERAQSLIMAGQVLVDGARVDKPGEKPRPEAVLTLTGDPNPYVSRGGLKLDGALTRFGLGVAAKVALDVGASTGGFTDCLLQRGAAKVYAVDVGYGQLAWKLRQDPRVINLERTNIRGLGADQIPDPLDLAVADCSFISLTKVLPHVLPLLRPGADLVVLVKPQFEVGKDRVGKGGVVRDEALRQEAIADVRRACEALGCTVLGGADSELAGPKGNLEHLLWLRCAG